VRFLFSLRAFLLLAACVSFSRCEKCYFPLREMPFPVAGNFARRRTHFEACSMHKKIMQHNF